MFQPKNVIFSVLLLLAAAWAEAKVSVAFFELYDEKTGKIIQLEPNGRFGHVAISYRGMWLHSYPGQLVQLNTTEEMQHFGRWAVTLELAHRNEPSISEMFRYRGKPFDFFSPWSDEHSTYCSKLVGQLLRLAPLPTTFSMPIWKQFDFDPESVNEGLSPDDIYQHLVRELQALRFESTAGDCQKQLLN